MPPRALTSTRPAPDEPLPYWYVAEPNEARDREAAERKEKRAAHAASRPARFEEHKNKGNDLFKAGNYLGALDEYNQAIRATGRYRPAMALPAVLNVIQTYLKLNMYEEAEEEATLALRIDPKNVKARFRRGLARKELDMLYPALIDFKTALKLEPTLEVARKELAETQKLWDIAEYGDDDDEEAIYPPPDDEPELKDEDDDSRGYDSDSSDSNHLGNTTPCRYYNQSRCKRGTECLFSHAPDPRALRDNLGRNVCIDFLTGRCRHSLDRCYFSHSTVYLPVEELDGKPYKWWEDKKAVRAIREARAFADDMAYFSAYGRLPPKGGRGRGRGHGRGSGRARGSGRSSGYGQTRRAPWEDDYDDYDDDYEYGFSRSDIDELLCQGVKPWDDDAWDVLDVLNGY